MANFELPARRLMVVSGFAAAIAIAPAVAVFAGPTPTFGTPLADCPAGESEDPYTFACVPEVVPNSSGPVVPAGAPSEQELTECSGHDQADCLEQDYYGTPGATVPHVDTTVHQDP